MAIDNPKKPRPHKVALAGDHTGHFLFISCGEAVAVNTEIFDCVDEVYGPAEDYIGTFLTEAGPSITIAWKDESEEETIITAVE